jgi:hypothetical protein
MTGALDPSAKSLFFNSMRHLLHVSNNTAASYFWQERLGIREAVAPHPLIKSDREIRKSSSSSTTRMSAIGAKDQRHAYPSVKLTHILRL